MSESLRDKQSWYDFCVYCKGALGQHNRLECECECHPPRFQAEGKKACFHNSGSMGIEHPCPECGEMLCWNLDLAGKPSTQPLPSDVVEEFIRKHEYTNCTKGELRELVRIVREEAGTTPPASPLGGK